MKTLIEKYLRGGDETLYTIVAALVALASAYLMLFNLGNFTLWHDEGTNALMAASLARDGTLSAWDGRNLFYGVWGGDNRFAINEDLWMAAYPPWPAIPSALGLLLFGEGEFALRFPHALLGALCLPVFWLLLRMNFPARPRLRLLAFTLFALSPIVLLYMRQGRYYPDAILFTLLSLYCYQRFWRDDNARWLAGLCVFTILNFLNHFAIGFSFAAALASWHVVLYWRETARRRWILLASAGAMTAAVCGGYLLFAGVVGGESALEYDAEVYKHSWLKRRALLSYIYARDIVRAGWLPLWIALWWAWYAFRLPSAPKKSRRRRRESDSVRAANRETELQIRRWGVLALLTALFVVLTSVTPAFIHNAFADMRYMVSLPPLLALLTAACVDWLWAKHKIAGGGLLAVLLFSNFAGAPFLVQGGLCTGDFSSKYHAAEKFPLVALAAEIHRDDHPTGTAEAVSYLRANAAQDDTIFVQPAADSAVLLSYLSDKLIFCCGLSPDAKLPEDKIRALGAPVYRGDATPKWFVTMNQSPDAAAPKGYDEVYSGEIVSYPVHRPELEFHCFGESNLPMRTRIFRRRDG